MLGGSLASAPLRAVFEQLGNAHREVEEKVHALEQDASYKQGVIDKQNGEIRSLKGEIDTQVQEIDQRKGENSSLEKTKHEQAQQISHLQQQLSALRQVSFETADEAAPAARATSLSDALSVSVAGLQNETLREENNTLQTNGSQEQRRAEQSSQEQRRGDGGEAGSKRDGPAALEGPAKLPRTEPAQPAQPAKAADAELGYAAADAGGSAVDDGSGTEESVALASVASDATEEMITEAELPGASLAEGGPNVVPEIGEIGEIGETAGAGAPCAEVLGGAEDTAMGGGAQQAAEEAEALVGGGGGGPEAAASGALMRLEEQKEDQLLPPTPPTAAKWPVLQLVHFSVSVKETKEGDAAWGKETVLALKQDGSLYAFASAGPGADLSRQGAEVAEGSCGRCLLGPVEDPASVDPAEMRMQHTPLPGAQKVVVLRQGQLICD